MKKILAFMLTVVMILVCFTGCMYGEDRIEIKEDGTTQTSSKIVLEKAVCDEILDTVGMTLEDMGWGDAKVQTVDGVESYVIEAGGSFSSFSEVKEGLKASGYTGVYVSKNGLRFVLDTGIDPETIEALESLGMDLGNGLRAKAIITMPEEILMTTGTLSDDKKTAEFTLDGKDFYQPQEFMVSTAQETKKPTVDGVINKKTYNAAKEVTVNDASGIKTAQYKKGAKGKKYSFKLAKTFNVNGTYTIYATDYYGNKTTKSFTIKDTKKPTISGVTNKKSYSSTRTLKFKDNCGVKSVKLYRNGKKQTVTSEDILLGELEVKKVGSYKVVVTDVNGLSKTVTFKIK
ncbi:MAG: hypothetical protein HFE73_02690 [Firmicutes bacterium]|nr:hypothetical protein [Bacillota bacterium]